MLLILIKNETSMFSMIQAIYGAELQEDRVLVPGILASLKIKF